ncbi:MAG TPA: ABC transporter ATP-binding protein [Gemmatimonadaceae bacterium]
MISTNNLSKSYGEKLALDRLTMRVEPGEILGFLGPNGAGKSTTVRILTGLLTPDSGTASVAGFDVVKDPLEAKRRVGYVPETPVLYESLTADEYLDLIGCLYHLEPATSESRRAELLELFDLGDARHQGLQEFSKGMRQKVVIAAALIHRPEVLILDEPLDGLDANTALVMKELLRKLAAQSKTIMFSSHILEVVERICTRITIINHGRFVTQGTSAEICAEAGVATLDEAFGRLTGVRDVGQVTADFLSALDRA